MIAPTLIVGLGGTGSDIVQRVAKQVTKEQRKKIGFVVFDTDVNELRGLKEKNGFIKTVQTSTRMTVGEYLNIDVHARDNWFPINRILSRKTLSEGAGQVRAISRLALDTSIRTGGMEPLHQAIQELYKLEGKDEEQALRVIIVSSLAGGTGSGLILPVSLYIKQYLISTFQQSANITRGFFILPEVFYSVIKGESERNNLKCNAYATIRELDTFLMRGDGTLPKKYEKKVKFEIPRIGSDKCDNYNVMPFDFCFLFDALNISGKNLNTFNQYKDHAASCIYAQSIGPMNKRSNSSEDNTIRDLCRSGGRNRYAGAGSSMLIYPYQDIERFLTLKWAEQCVSEQWLVFDKQYKEKSILNNEMRSRGYNVKEIDAGADYINSVTAAANQKNPFGSFIVNACGVFDSDGLERISDKWLVYVSNLKRYIEEITSSGQRELDMQKETAAGRVGGLGQEGDIGWDSFYNAYIELAKYKGMVFKRSDEMARTISYMMFQAENDSITKEKHKHQLETYLRDDNDEFLHPNAVRYFLYQTIDLLKKEKLFTDNEVRECIDFFETFDKMAFDNPDTGEVVETAEDLLNRKTKFIQSLKKSLSGEQEDLVQKYRNFMEMVDRYRTQSIYQEVLKGGIEYVGKLAKAFQVFYNSFDGSVRGIEREVKRIKHKYGDLKGYATRYVCATEDCFDKFDKRMPFTGNALNLSGELSDKIYMKIRKYAMLREKPGNDSFFAELFEKDILGYFKESLLESYSREIDIDIIEALELEAEFEEEIYDEANKRFHIESVIRETKILASPFIEKPLGEQRTQITASAYNPTIDKKEDPQRHDLVMKEFSDGVADDDISKNMILFYNSIYGLRANDLSKFAPPKVDKTAEREGGEYYKAYFELVAQIRPKSDETPVISPHLDKNWHIISILPDLDEQNQREMEKEIYKALFYGILLNKIQYRSVSAVERRYKLVFPGIKPQEFVVSNGTPCDTFFEILDALTINPLVVRRINDFSQEYFRREILSNEINRFEDSKMKVALEKVRYYEHKAFKDRQISIFDVVMLLKLTAPMDEMDDDQGRSLINIMMDEIYQYMSNICPEHNLKQQYGQVIIDQYKVYQANLSVYDKLWGDRLGEYCIDIVDTAVYNLQDKKLLEQAEVVQEYNNQYIRLRDEKMDRA